MTGKRVGSFQSLKIQQAAVDVKWSHHHLIINQMNWLWLTWTIYFDMYKLDILTDLYELELENQDY